MDDPFDAWLRSLDETDRRTAAVLRRYLTQLDAPDPEGWTRSEIEEDIPQLARFLVLRRLWPDAVDAWHDNPAALESVPAARRLLNRGASRADLAQFARAVAYEAVATLLTTIEEGRDVEAPDGSPGWALVETDMSGEPTGRVLRALHEDLAALDPSGLDARDLWE